MTKPQGIGTYLAQGWAANATLTYLLLVGMALFSAALDDWAGLLIVMPIYVSIIGTVGAAVGLFIWLAEFVTGRKINILFRGAAAILLPVLLTTIAALSGFLHNVFLLLWITAPLVILALPPALLSGSGLNPLKIIVMDLAESLPKYGWGRALFIIAIPLLRFASLLGALEALLFLACQRPDLSAWSFAEQQFAGSVIAVVYFAITFTVSLCLPRKNVVVAMGIVSNLPVAALAVMSHQLGGTAYLSLAIVSGSFVSLWTLFVISQLLRSETRRILPVTMFEIRLRHALNYW